ncbi:tRNA(Arg) A34 adenosine deaminase TadA [Amycolatopsis lurida]|uniref:Cytidine deaminase n=1 Tax=Amycolatopsis lurida NRRL 2430 TaxID=1460371 RepID=A0A2P2FJ14_AMYLU|nr:MULTISPECIES: nucleoside deaminase [Amycolatopsis]KFU76709.1 cytidine deaminase [Amycolatopsis lurida NRRL 2430]QXV57033.1 nucleoside deaminase [Amycolatopsis sp. TNS106]SEB37821.1 tRNA(Arg) A34 adenosine deaminase TadA [Amycolatopsis lurida]
MTEEDEKFLRRAIELAAKSRKDGDPPFGSLLVGPDGTVLAEDHNTSVSQSDISLHPELKLAVWAARELEPAVAAKTTMYTSCQPCGMCQGAIERSGLGKVVFALSGEQVTALKPPVTAPPVRLEGPALYDEARVPVEGYYTS